MSKFGSDFAWFNSSMTILISLILSKSYSSQFKILAIILSWALIKIPISFDTLEKKKKQIIFSGQLSLNEYSSLDFPTDIDWYVTLNCGCYKRKGIVWRETQSLYQISPYLKNVQRINTNMSISNTCIEAINAISRDKQSTLMLRPKKNIFVSVTKIWK